MNLNATRRMPRPDHEDERRRKARVGLLDHAAVHEVDQVDELAGEAGSSEAYGLPGEERRAAAAAGR